MRTTLPRVALVLVIGLLMVLLGRSADDSAKQARRSLKDVYLKDGKEWHSLDTLVDNAWRYLTSKTNVPPVEREVFVVWIDRSDTNHLISVTFGAGIGNQFWEVRIGPTGQAQSYITGSMVDSHRTFGPGDK